MYAESKQKASVIPIQPFLRASMKELFKTTSLGNGAVKLISTGNPFVDQFGKVGSYRQIRQMSEIHDDMHPLWATSPLLTVCFVIYLRMITRIVKLFSGKKTLGVQRGAGLKHEAIMRMIWIYVHYPETFWKNISTFIAIGCWRDIITMMSYDIQANGWKDRTLNWDEFGKLILAGLENPEHSELVKKYLPSIKSNKLCTTPAAKADNVIAKWLCYMLFGNKSTQFDLNAIPNYNNYKKYRLLKSSGKAHEWQQLISQGKFLSINFDTIHGRALAQLVSSKFLENQNLTEAYDKWISTKPLAKYTGYVHELLSYVKEGYNNKLLKPWQTKTINAQFLQLVETARKDMNTESSFIVALDTSASMTSSVPGLKTSSYIIGKSLALFFAHLLDGPFKHAWFEFNDKAKLKTWKGSTPVEMFQNDASQAYGSTNLQSITELWCQLRSEGISEEHFPTGIICISDNCFNPAGSQTNYDAMIQAITPHFSQEYLDKFTVVFWNIPNTYYGEKPQMAFETLADTKNVFYFSAFDGSILAFLMGTSYSPRIPQTAEELFGIAMNQEIMQNVEI